MKKNKGITLVALIITIIIMLILIAVTVSLVVNSNLLGRAKNAGDEWEAAQVRDNNEANNFEAQIADWEASLCNHEWSDYVVTTQATCSTAGVQTSTCSKCGATKTQTIAKLSHALATWTIITDNTNADYGKEQSTCSRCHETIKRYIVGATISNYNPSVGPNNETISTSYVSAGSRPQTTGGEYGDGTNGNGYSNQTFTVESITAWKVLGEENGQVIITSSSTLRDLMYFRGQAGYAHFIEELNKISSIYGQGQYADTSKCTVSLGEITVHTGGRSINADDLEKIGYTVTRVGFTGQSTATYEARTEDDESIKIYKEGATSGGQAIFRYWDGHVSGGSGTWQTLTTGNVTLGNYVKSIVNPNSVTTLAHNMITKKPQIVDDEIVKNDGVDVLEDASYWLGDYYLSFTSQRLCYLLRTLCEGS